jgi:hypothetical protein
MFTIRQGQMDVCEQAARRAFVEQTLGLVEEYFPKHYALLGPQKIREIIPRGWERAKGHGFTSERCVRLYLSLTFMLGSGFASDPQLPWAAEILQDATLADEDLRIDYVYHQAEDYLYRVAGDLEKLASGGNAPGFLDEIGRLRRAPDTVPSPARLPAFTAWLLERLAGLFPAKYQYVGEGGFRRLIQRGLDSARKYGLATERGVGIYTALMFVLGSGCDTDPIWPWVATVLNDKSLANPAQKADRLFDQAVAYLKAWAAAGNATPP